MVWKRFCDVTPPRDTWNAVSFRLRRGTVDLGRHNGVCYRHASGAYTLVDTDTALLYELDPDGFPRDRTAEAPEIQMFCVINVPVWDPRKEAAKNAKTNGGASAPASRERRG